MDWSSKRAREGEDSNSSKKPRDDDWGSSGWADDSSNKKPSDDDWGASSRTEDSSSKKPRNDDWGSSGRRDDSSNKKPRNNDWGASSRTEDSSSKKPRNEDWGSSGWTDDNKPSSGNQGEGRSQQWSIGGADGDWNSNNKSKGGEESERPQHFKPEQLDLEEEAKLLSDGAAQDFKHYDEQKVTCLPPNLIGPVETFEDIVTSKLLLENIKAQRYTNLTPIQKWAMPAIMEDHDLIACAQTGSGKTAAFLTPVLQTLLNTELEPHDPNGECQNPYCLIISPTRELANQIYVHSLMLSKDSILKCQVMYGQIATAHLRSKLLSGCHVLVSTPGRLKDFLNRGWIGFTNIRYVILDEGDRLVDEGFTEDIKFFFNHPTMPPKDKRQTLFFSATFKQSTQLNAKQYLKDDFIFLTVGRIGAANADIRQEFMKVSRSEKKRELKKILNEVPKEEKTIVFTQTKTAADMLAGFFTALNLSSTSIHGDRLQSQREQAIKAFKKGEKRFLISSPVGNRGLDLPKVALVINYDLPNNIDEYVHRIGRTGRAGHTGRAISFYDEERDRDILPDLIEILKEVKQEIPDWMLAEISGQPAATGNDEWGNTNNNPTNEGDSNGKDKPSGADDEWGAPTGESTKAGTDDWGSNKPESDNKKTDDNQETSDINDGWV